MRRRPKPSADQRPCVSSSLARLRSKRPISIAYRTLVPVPTSSAMNDTTLNTGCIRLMTESPSSPMICPQMTLSESPIKYSTAIAKVAVGRNFANLLAANVIINGVIIPNRSAAVRKFLAAFPSGTSPTVQQLQRVARRERGEIREGGAAKLREELGGVNDERRLVRPAALRYGG